jgi:hypothetical protein
MLVHKSVGAVDCFEGLAEVAGEGVGVLKGIQQVTHPRGRDRQRPAASTPPGRPRRLQAQVKLTLTGGQALPGRSLQQLKLHVVMGRADVLDIP